MLLGVLLLVHWSVQQNQPRRKPVKKGTASISHLPELLLFNRVSLAMLTCVSSSCDSSSSDLLLEPEKQKDAAIEQLQKQINDIVIELNLLKEQQALQTGSTHHSLVSK